MGICKKCGSVVRSGVVSCPSCGSVIEKLRKTDGSGGRFDSADIAQNKVTAALSYIGILVIFPLATKESKFARWHAGQGLVLLALSFLYSAAYSVLAGLMLSVSWEFYSIFRIVRMTGLVIPVLAAIGISNALNGRAKELPVIGKIRLLKDI